MHNAIKKLLAFLLLAAAVLTTMWLSLNIKYRAIEELYSSTQLEIRAMEAEQYVNIIEYGIKYGKQLEYYFNIDEILNNIYMSSSYMEGVYVLGSGGNLLFYVGDETGRIPDVSKMALGDSLYGSLDYGDTIYIYMDIGDQNNATQGKLLIKLDGNTLRNIITREKTAAFRQSAIIGLEICALGAVIIIASKIKPGRKRLRSYAIVFSICVLLSLGLDYGMETVKISQTVENTTAQSAQEIAQVIQEQIDNVVNKGVSTEDLNDLNSYLKKNVSSCKMIDSLTLASRDKIQAQVSQSYIRDTVNGFVSNATMLLLSLIGVCTALNGALWLATRSGYKRKNNRRIGVKS